MIVCRPPHCTRSAPRGGMWRVRDARGRGIARVSTTHMCWMSWRRCGMSSSLCQVFQLGRGLPPACPATAAVPAAVFWLFIAVVGSRLRTYRTRHRTAATTGSVVSLVRGSAQAGFGSSSAAGVL